MIVLLYILFGKVTSIYPYICISAERLIKFKNTIILARIAIKQSYLIVGVAKRYSETKSRGKSLSLFWVKLLMPPLHSPSYFWRGNLTSVKNILLAKRQTTTYIHTKIGKSYYFTTFFNCLF